MALPLPTLELDVQLLINTYWLVFVFHLEVLVSSC